MFDIDLPESRILVVDDEQANVTIITRILRKAGYQNVTSTTDSREVDDLWRSFRPDLLLLDLMMPHLDGFAVMDMLGAKEWIQDNTYVPILVLTADVTPATRNRALAGGAKDFLTKPLDHDEVRLRVRNLLETRALHVAMANTNELLERKVAVRTTELRDSLQELEEAHNDLRVSREETVRRLSMAAELRDDDTGHHIIRMSRYAAMLSEATGAGNGRCSEVELAMQMHDVGKIGIPDSILLKPGKFTPDERSLMERHCEIGHAVLAGSSSDLLELAASVALTHHERVDGGGYPRRLRGDEIPIEGRIAAIADVFDALTSDRVYRTALPVEKALGILRDGRGSHFDAELLDVFFDTLPEVLAAKARIESEDLGERRAV